MEDQRLDNVECIRIHNRTPSGLQFTSYLLGRPYFHHRPALLFASGRRSMVLDDEPRYVLHPCVEFVFFLLTILLLQGNFLLGSGPLSKMSIGKRQTVM